MKYVLCWVLLSAGILTLWLPVWIIGVIFVVLFLFSIARYYRYRTWLAVISPLFVFLWILMVFWRFLFFDIDIWVDKSWFEQEWFIVSTWVIVEQRKNDSYVFHEEKSWRMFLLSTKSIENEHIHIWTVVLLQWYMQATHIGCLWCNGFDNVSSVVYGDFDFMRWLVMKWYDWYINVSSLHIQRTWDVSFKEWFVWSLRAYVIDRISTVYTWHHDAMALLSGLLLWDVSYMSDAVYKKFVKSWLVHLVAVSWWNMMMLALLLYAVLFWVPYYIRNICIAVWLLVYAHMCWWDSSVTRALIMWLLSIVAVSVWRGVSIWRLLMYASMGMVLINPYVLLYDLWFILSFTALIGIIICQKYISRVYEYVWTSLPVFVRRCLDHYVFPSIGATLGVLPFLLFFTEQVNMFSIIGNIFVVPAIPIIMLYGFISLFIWLVMDLHFVVDIWSTILWYVYWISDWSIQYGIYISLDVIWVKYVFLIMSVLLYIVVYTSAYRKL